MRNRLHWRRLLYRPAAVRGGPTQEATVTTRRLVRAARVANATLDGWLRDAVVEVVDGRIASVGSARRPAVGHRDDRRGRRPRRRVAAAGLRRDAHPHALPGGAGLSRDRPAGAGRTLDHPGDRCRCARLLLSGATTARDTGSRDGRGAGDPVGGARRRHPGPRLLVVGAPITTTAGHYWFLGGEADTTEAVVARVRERKKAGVDAIKLMASGGGYTPTSNPRSRAVRARDDAGRGATRRTAWDCRSWPTR